MDVNILKALAFVSTVMAVMMAILLYYIKVRRRAANLRTELNKQRKDALRSVKFMLKQMEYDAEVLRLLRHARISKENEDKAAFNGALDELIAKEKGMMKRLETAAEFEEYLKKTYCQKKTLISGGKKSSKKDRPDEATPEQMRSDIETFIKDLERIRDGETKPLDEKVEFFGRWVEGPERAELHESLRAMEKFLEAGDTKGLAAIAERKKAEKKEKLK